MKRYAYMVVGVVLALAVVAGAESITKELIGPSYGTATVAGDSSTLATTLTVDTVRATTVTAGYTNLTAGTDFAVSRALSAGSLDITTNVAVGGKVTSLTSYAGGATAGTLAVSTNASVGTTLSVGTTMTALDVYAGGAVFGEITAATNITATTVSPTTLTVSGVSTHNGNTVLGNATTDVVTITCVLQAIGGDTPALAAGTIYASNGVLRVQL